jgi:type VI secretion system protein ImpB
MDNIQHLIDKVRSPRVQITYDVETNGAKVLKELPYIIGIFADIMGHTTKDMPYLQRKFIHINGGNFNDVMAYLGVQVTVNIKDKQDQPMAITVPLNTINDFHPDQLSTNLEPLAKLQQQLFLLKDLKRKLMSNNKTMDMFLENLPNLKKLLDESSNGDSNNKSDNGTKKPSTKKE